MGADMKTELEEKLKSIECLLRGMSEDERLSTLNIIRSRLHELSPFKDEPVDCVLWIKASKLKANEYNPNIMAPTEQRLLYTSLLTEGYTQPVVATKGLKNFTVVDGYHRMQQGKHKPVLRERLKGYLPVVILHHESGGEGERRAATVRHNRARGQHAVAAMSELVRDLSRLGWSDERTAKELGMDKDEVLRLKQISGLAEMFGDESFSEAWTVE
ncbi:ParB-like nuclease domain-containing protein [Salmonella enterica]|nr:ParB-like nuclease domain-containing protein [Salmonella enterica]EKA4660588.1 ParB-like nuclease domain-containing protein [Salmonella enterica]EKF8527572.1 ParB-like nuclease domain-containing protein [Salmonella enterica]EKM8518303.1 ParB-like nuclease domain-containing protein [Salmonella enterica]ELB6048614.1 ParB-like nuclease domain-containing protein [Salmonella enterica]